MIVPPGYLFRPSDEELLVFYLGRKIKGLPLPCDVFIERDIYGVKKAHDADLHCVDWNPHDVNLNPTG
ncbi:hypothetical protein Vadar_018905 [Vaccinium darrowii]|uniref:Uncharacterized protein n=1 Tax=Vaccinium darrowii TaxID=229202 RepID=A0ACB7Y7Y5_9ERIC|nr:hypothetical protein Vadar_018905 [Vaccinium darrowii]